MFKISHPKNTRNISTFTPQPPKELWQKDFDNGPVLLYESGTYTLMEDIIFNPFPNKFEDIFDSLSSFPEYHHQYVLGYFAAIIIYGNYINLNLNNHTIRQSYMHNLQQRFFSIIELADRPFLPGQGPAAFGEPLTGCSHVKIHNGVLGLSSHHGIHGNNVNYLELSNITIYDYEVAGITINGSNNIKIDNVDIRHNFKNIKVNGLFSNAVFAVKKLIIKEQQEPNAFVKTANGDITAYQILTRLKKSIVDTVSDILNNQAIGTTNPDSFFYHNPSGLTDGNCYGISLNSSGLLVNEYKQHYENNNTNITLNNIVISDIECKPCETLTITETPYDQLGLNPQTLSPVNKGPFGDVIQYFKCVDHEGRFNIQNNPLVLSQILTGTVSSSMREWIISGNSDFNERIKNLTILTNLDIMAHMMKGTIGLFISSGNGITCNNILIKNIKNYSEPGCDEYLGCEHKYIGARTCGVLIASSNNITIKSIDVDNIESKCGEAYGIYHYGECKNIQLNNYKVGTLTTHSNYIDPPINTLSIVKTMGYDKTFKNNI